MRKMNNKFREIAKKAGFNVPTSGIKAEDFDVMHGETNVDAELENFAKLLLQECIRIDIKNWDAPTGDAIREHFEVD